MRAARGEQRALKVGEHGVPHLLARWQDLLDVEGLDAVSVDVVRSDPAQWKHHDGSLALQRARIIDACYRSARENQEVAL